MYLFLQLCVCVCVCALMHTSTSGMRISKLFAPCLNTYFVSVWCIQIRSLVALRTFVPINILLSLGTI